MAVNIKFDKVVFVEIGNNAAYIQINNVVSFADRVVSPDGDMVYPMQFINLFSPTGVHHHHKYWELELVLDTDYLSDSDFPLQYWAYFLDVQAAVSPSPAIVCDNEFNYIERFKVYIREDDGTQTCLTYASADQNVLWCIGETSNFSNESGVQHQTKTFRFICLKEREKTYPAVVRAPGTHGYLNEAPVKTKRIDNFTIPGEGSCTNILQYSDDFVTQIAPQFMPNVFQGLDVKQDTHWRILTIVVDSESDIFDPYIDITTANTVIPPNFYLMTTLADGASTPEYWIYTSSISYMIRRAPGRIDDDSARDTFEYQIITTCDRTVGDAPP